MKFGPGEQPPEDAAEAPTDIDVSEEAGTDTVVQPEIPFTDQPVVQEAVIPLTADNFERESENYRWDIFTILKSVVGNPQEAEDLTQDVFANTWKQLSGARPIIERPRLWLRRSALNAAITVLRRREVVKILPEALIEANDEYAAFMEQQVQSGDMADTVSDREKLRYILAHLPPKEHETFLLHCYHDLTHEEIADLLGIPISSVHGRMQRARAHARQLAHEFDHPDESGISS